MIKKCFIIGNYVKKEKINDFLSFLKNRLKFNLESVYIYEIEDNENEYLTTIKSYNKSLLRVIKYSTILHIKSGTLFSINALNKLIDEEKKGSFIKNEDFKLNWNKYKNKLISLTNNQLRISNLKRILINIE